MPTHNTKLGLTAFTLTAGVCLLPAFAAPKKPAPKVVSYEKQVAPLLQKYCGACHGANETAGVNVTQFKTEASVEKGRPLWMKIQASVRDSHMPPKNAAQPTAAERTLIAQWIEDKFNKLDCDLKDPGRVTMRRLNRAEYNNTVRDLFGLDLRPADEFPSDDVGYGFDNIGDVLSISPILMEKYLNAADKIVAKAIVTPDPPATRFEAELMPKETRGDGLIKDFYRLLVSNGEVTADFQFPKDGEYLLRARAFEQKAGDERAKMTFRVEGRDVQTVDVDAVEEAARVYEVKIQARAGRRRVAVYFGNDFYMPRSPNPRERDRNLAVDYLEVVGPLNAGPVTLPDSHRRIFGTRPEGITDTAYARRILSFFASRAFRRPVTPPELDRLTAIVAKVQKNGDSFERGIQLALEAVLVSPSFLFRLELDPKPNDPKANRFLNDYELASRLSYFVWSSMPDDELFALARKGELKKPAVLEAQARRMLADPKSEALVENFMMQWLTLRNLQNVSPDPRLFPGFNEQLKKDMLVETQMFCSALMREDRSVLDLLDGKFTFLNERLARHYGIPGVTGEQFRRVALTGEQRGGILTQGSILTVTSNPTRTSPVKRGKWVLEQLLGTPPPPPPPDVPELESPKNAKLTGTLRQRMEQHRVDPACATCHARLDPLGFGLENYDAVGAWRTLDGGAPVDASGELPDGQRFNGPSQLVAILKKQKDTFGRNMASQMLTYALGRGLEHYDQCGVGEITAAASKKNYKFSALVTEIVISTPFRSRRGDGGEE
jgi:mono/diheme cytochrome c family protein